METKEVIREIREKSGLSQNEMAERLHVTRQAVSRWENGETKDWAEEDARKYFEGSLRQLNYWKK